MQVKTEWHVVLLSEVWAAAERSTMFYSAPSLYSCLLCLFGGERGRNLGGGGGVFLNIADVCFV